MEILDKYLSILNEQDTPLSRLKRDIIDLLKRKKYLEAEQAQLKQRLISPKYKKNPALSFTASSEQIIGKKQLDAVRRELTAKLKELDKLKDVVIKDVVAKVKEKLVDNPSQLSNLGKYILASIAITAAIALIFYNSNQLYKRYLSKHARSCSKLKGKSKTFCILKSQLKALGLQKKTLQKLTPGCSKSEDAKKCKGKLSHKILKLTRRISKSSMRLKELK